METARARSRCGALWPPHRGPHGPRQAAAGARCCLPRPSHPAFHLRAVKTPSPAAGLPEGAAGSRTAIPPWRRSRAQARGAQSVDTWDRAGAGKRNERSQQLRRVGREPLRPEAESSQVARCRPACDSRGTGRRGDRAHLMITDQRENVGRLRRSFAYTRVLSNRVLRNLLSCQVRSKSGKSKSEKFHLANN